MSSIKEEVRHIKEKKYLWLIMLIVITSILFFSRLHDRGLLEPDEGRYAEIPREMIELKDWITPHLNYIKYFEKPPLFYWLTALSFKLFGVNEFAARFWSAAFALGGVILVYLLGRRLYGERAGFLSGLILATSLEYMVLSQILILDMGLTFFITSSLFFFYIGTLRSQKNKIYYYLFYASMAIGTLIKGPIALVLPSIIIIAYIFITRQWSIFRELAILKGILLYIIITLPWFLMVSLKNREFFWFYFIEEHIMRFLTAKHDRPGPIYYFIPVLIAGFFPWISFLPSSIIHFLKRYGEEKRDILFLLVWAIIIFIFFSVSGSKLITYILPVFPPLSILVGRFWKEILFGDNCIDLRKRMSLSLSMLFLLTILIIIAIVVFLNISTKPWIPLVRTHFYIFSFLLFIGALLSILFFYREKNGMCFFTLTAIMVLTFFLHLDGFKKFEPYKTSKPLSMRIISEMKPEDKIATYFGYEQSLPFYTKRRIIIVRWEGELKFGKNYNKENGYFPNENEYRDMMKSKDRVFTITSTGDFEHIKTVRDFPIYILEKYGDKILFSNKP